MTDDEKQAMKLVLDALTIASDGLKELSQHIVEILNKTKNKMGEATLIIKRE